MAEPLPYDRDGGEYNRGDMIIDEQQSTYHVFMGLTKWGSLAVVAVVLWASLAFAAGAGVINATLITAVLVVVGVFLLREKSTNPGNPAHE
jgi:hypothetical protein